MLQTAVHVHTSRHSGRTSAQRRPPISLFPRVDKQKTPVEQETCFSTASLSRSIGEVVADLVRGKLYTLYCELARRRNVGVGISFGATTTESLNQSATCCCKFLIVVESMASKQNYWLVHIRLPDHKQAQQQTKKKGLTSVDKIELYDDIDDVLCGSANSKLTLSGKNWFFFETLLKLYVEQGCDVLLEDFTECADCHP